MNDAQSDEQIPEYIITLSHSYDSQEGRGWAFGAPRPKPVWAAMPIEQSRRKILEHGTLLERLDQAIEIGNELVECAKRICSAKPESNEYPDGHAYVRVMCDYCADGVWTIDGKSMSFNELSISDTLKRRLDAWQAVYDTQDSMDENDNPENDESFMAEGLSIACEMKRQLPEWQIDFYNHYYFFADKPQINIEITPEVMSFSDRLTITNLQKANIQFSLPVKTTSSEVINFVPGKTVCDKLTN